MKDYCKVFAATMPTVQFALNEALGASRAYGFSGKDPGWPGMENELPPKLSKQQRRVILQSYKASKQSMQAAFEVSSVSDEDDGEYDDDHPLEHQSSQVHGLILNSAAYNLCCYCKFFVK